MQSVSEPRSLIGGISYYHKFLPISSKRLKSIMNLFRTVRGHGKNHVEGPPPGTWQASLPFMFRVGCADGPVETLSQLYSKAYPDEFGTTLEQEHQGDAIRSITFRSRTLFLETRCSAEGKTQKLAIPCAFLRRG